jgi:uncharacterized protein (DUF697 family)
MNTEIAISHNTVGATEILNNNVALAMGAGLIPLPLVDLAAITAVQLKMGKELAEFYGVDYKEDQIKGIVVSLIAAYTATSAASVTAAAAAKSIPVLGAVFGVITLPVVAGGLTYAVGKVFIQHIESGRTFISFDISEVQAGFLREVEKGKGIVSDQAKGFGAKMAQVSDNLENRLDGAINSLLKR